MTGDRRGNKPKGTDLFGVRIKGIGDTNKYGGIKFSTVVHYIIPPSPFRPIPKGVKRRVRQKCGFGCVICGCPIYDYEHIEEYTIVKKHEVDNLVLMCPTCHRKKTNGLITKEAVRDAAVVCRSRARTGFDAIPRQPYSLHIGGNIIQTFEGIVFQIYKFGYLKLLFREHPLIFAEILDANGERAIEIQKNVYTLCAKTWDIEYVGNTLTFRNAPRKIFASLTFDIPNASIYLTGKFEVVDGLAVTIDESGIRAGKHLLADKNLLIGCGAAITISDKPIRRGSVLVSGSVQYCTFNRIGGIAALNSIECIGNLLGSCEFGFVWTKDFFDELVANE